ncbi:GNAT family N-acetyltransferase [Hamadaea tsunoensis]|uniref:GNAT family N-acetyltransferase n=1 Tax=Hamadaea tsunoensis TaxID=53368 RepID=UPI00041FE296|nr:GNAT family N-acetyltransferase [Hamadaea tsunoensis]
MSLWRVRATVDDRPGYLAVLAASLALRSVNILSVQVHTTEAGAVDDFLVDAPAGLSEADLMAAVEKGRGRDAWIGRADAHGLVDPPTQALGHALRLVSNPEGLGDVLKALLDCEVSWRPARGAVHFLPDELAVTDPAGGMLVLNRRHPAFTPAEYARAQALAEIAAQATAAQLVQASLLLPDGSELSVRVAHSSDVEEIVAMHGRCSAESLYRRYLTGTRGPTAEQVARLVEPRRGCSLVAGTPDGRVVAFANLLGEGDLAEAALLVQDGWQGRGLGTALLRRLVALARPADIVAIELHTHADNAAMLRTVRRLGEPVAYDRDGSIVTATLALAGARQPA